MSNWPMWLFIAVIAVLFVFYLRRSMKTKEESIPTGNFDYLEDRFKAKEEVLKEAESVDVANAGYATPEARSELDGEVSTETFGEREVSVVETSDPVSSENLDDLKKEFETPSFVETNAEIQDTPDETPPPATPLADAVVEEKKTTKPKQKKASKKAHAIFTKRDVQYIRSKAAKSLTNRQLAQKFNCSASTISSVRNYQTYANVR